MRTLPIRRCVREVDVRAGNEVDLVRLSVSLHSGVVPRSDFGDRNESANDLSTNKRCWAGDIVLNRMRAFQGALGIAPQQGIVSPDYAVLRPSEQLDARFLAYAMKSEWFVGQMTLRLRGIGSPHLGSVRTPRINIEDLGDIRLPVPPLEQQRRIADFLDDQVARIDVLISVRRRQGVLERQAFASWLDASVSRLRRVPLRRQLVSVTSGPRGWGDLVDDVGERMFVRINNISGDGIEPSLSNVAWVSPAEDAESNRARLMTGDLLVSITASIGDVAVAGSELEGAAFSQHVARVRLVNPRVARAVAWSASAPTSRDLLLNSAAGGTKIGLGLQQVADWAIPVFSADADQFSGASDERHAHLRQMSTALERTVDTLAEYKSSLVTAAVMGELDVTAARWGVPA